MKSEGYFDNCGMKRQTKLKHTDVWTIYQQRIISVMTMEMHINCL